MPARTGGSALAAASGAISAAVARVSVRNRMSVESPQEETGFAERTERKRRVQNMALRKEDFKTSNVRRVM
jgi:hypothetical protein